jgi:hypothetical protein
MFMDRIFVRLTMVTLAVVMVVTSFVPTATLHAQSSTIGGVGVAPVNHQFEEEERLLAVPSINGDFAQGAQPLDPSTYPPNANFSSGSLAGWSVSDGSQVQITNDGAGVDGAYLWFKTPNQWIRSGNLVVPMDAQSLQFMYHTWSGFDANDTVPVIVDVFHGENVAQQHRLPFVFGSLNQGWQLAILDVQAFRGQTIQLHIRSEEWGGRMSQARIDQLRFVRDVPGWDVSDAAWVAVDHVTSDPASTALWIKRPYQWVRSQSFTVPVEAQQLRFVYMAWTPKNANETVPLHVDVYSGPSSTTLTRLPILFGSFHQGWQEGVLDIQAFRGQVIQLRFGSEEWGGRDAQVRLDRIRFREHVPGWSVSDAAKVVAGSPALVTSETSDLPNAQFDATINQWPVDAGNLDFTQTAAVLTSTLNADFHGGSLQGWDVSDPTRVATADDAMAIDGSYLHIKAPFQWARSASVTVPTQAQRLEFWYQTGSAFNANELVPFLIDVLNGPAFAVRTRLELLGSYTQGWQRGSIDVQSFQGQIIQLRLTSQEWGGNNAQLRVDQLRFVQTVPGWESSNARFVTVSDRSAPAPNGDMLPSNAGFAQGPQVLSAAPANANFSSALSGWNVSDAAWVQVVNNAQSNAGPHVHLMGPSQWVRSSSVTVPPDAQSMHIDYTAWTPNDPNEIVPVIVDIWSGLDLDIRTRVEWIGSLNQGWQTGILDLQPFRGQTIQIHLRSEEGGGRMGQARFDTLRLVHDTPGWAVSHPAWVQLGNDSQNINGAYLHLRGPYQHARSTAFTLALTAQSLTFDYFAWTPNSPTERVPLWVEVLSGVDFGVRTRFFFEGSAQQGWQQGTVDVSPFRGRVIQVRVLSEEWGSRAAQARVDNLAVTGNQPPATPSDANPDTTALWIAAPFQWARSASVTVPEHAQRLEFWYQTGSAFNANELIPFSIEVLNGPALAVQTRFELLGSYNQGWQRGSIDVQSFQEQTIQLRFRTQEWGSNNAQLRVDQLRFVQPVPGWVLSDARQIAVRTDAASRDGAYVQLSGPNLALRSPDIMVPMNSEQLQFWFNAWTPNDPNERVPVFVEALSGPLFDTVTVLTVLEGNQAEGWKQASIDISAFRKRTIQLRIRSDEAGGRRGHVRLDSLAFAGNVTSAPRGWDTTTSQVVQLRGSGQSAVSSMVALTTTNQLRFDYLSYTPRNALAPVALHVEVLHGVGLTQTTRVRTLWSAGVDGWRPQTLVDLRAFAGQTIRVRFVTDTDWGANLQVWIDNVLFDDQGAFSAFQTSGASTPIASMPSACPTVYRVAGSSSVSFTTPNAAYIVRILAQYNTSRLIFQSGATERVLYGVGDMVGGALPRNAAATIHLYSPEPRATFVEICTFGTWESLINNRPPVAIQRELLCRTIPESVDHPSPQQEGYPGSGDPAYTQRIETGYGPISLDSYNIRFNIMPAQFNNSAKELLDFIRADMNRYIDVTISDFTPYSVFYPYDVGGDDLARWSSPSPQGAIMHFDVNEWYGNGVEEASIVTSLYEGNANEARWRWATIWIAGDLAHPLSGVREFGVKREGNGWLLYTRAADRPVNFAYSIPALSFGGFTRGSELWQSWQRGIERLVLPATITGRTETDYETQLYEWNAIRDSYWHANNPIPWINHHVERCQR